MTTRLVGLTPLVLAFTTIWHMADAQTPNPHTPPPSLAPPAIASRLLHLGPIDANGWASFVPGSNSQIVLAPGGSSHIPETDLTLALEGVVEDSRCPTGQTCLREGDAAVRLRLEKPGAAPSTLTLHTGGPGQREADVEGVNVRLVDVTPYPAGDTKPQQEEYRVTLLVRPR